MPQLAWRSDADGFAFENSWTLDGAERAALTSLVPAVGPAAVAAIAAVVPPDPILLTAVGLAVQSYLALGPSPGIGLCGGMAYASLDYWRAHVPLPRGAHKSDQPARNAPAPTAVRNMIWSRLLDSLQSGGVLRQTLEWSLLLNQVPPPFGGGGTLLARTQQEFAKLKGHIDAGEPWPIGLVYANDVVWEQHQILIYGYELTGTSTATLFVYDCNEPHQYGDPLHSTVTLNFTGPALVATTPSDFGRTLAGFFCSNYVAVTPPNNLATSFGQFLNWMGDPKTWMVAGGARMPVAGTAELASLGGSTTDVRATGATSPVSRVRPRDGTLFRERSAAPVFVYQGGAPFWIPDPTWLDRFGGWNATRVVPDNTISTFAGLPDEGTLLREWSDPKVYRIMSGQRRWVTTPAELEKYGGFQNVRLVPDGGLASIPEGQVLPTPTAPLKTMKTLATPSAVKVNRSNAVTITASDAQSNSSINGRVLVNGLKDVGKTGVRVTIPYLTVLRTVPGGGHVAAPPTVLVRAPGYKDGGVKLTWSE